MIDIYVSYRSSKRNRPLSLFNIDRPFLREAVFVKGRMSKMKACLGYLRRGGKKDCRNQDNDYDDVSKEFFISDSYNQHTLQVFTIDKGNG